MKDTWNWIQCFFLRSFFGMYLLQILTTLQRTVKHAPKHGQEQILVYEPTTAKPWFKLASDIFDIKGKSYIVITGHYSRFPYVKQLPNITSLSIINVFKTLFADHGFCDILVTDNGSSPGSNAIGKSATCTTMKCIN